METSIFAGNSEGSGRDTPLTPHRKPLRTWAGHGTGAPCHRCGESILAHEIEYEIELPSTTEERAKRYQARGAGPSLRFHFQCYRKWAGR